MLVSCDDACQSDVRLAELCEKYNVPMVFYWPVEWHSLAIWKGYKPLTFEQAVDLADKYEIGGHTITHRHLTDLDYDEACREISDSKYMLEDLLGVTITKFAPPRGYTNARLTNFTLEVYDSQRLTKGKGLVHIHRDSGVNGNKPWRQLLDKNTKEIWCHSWELDKYELWEELEGILSATTNS